MAPRISMYTIKRCGPPRHSHADDHDRIEHHRHAPADGSVVTVEDGLRFPRSGGRNFLRLVVDHVRGTGVGDCAPSAARAASGIVAGPRTFCSPVSPAASTVRRVSLASDVAVMLRPRSLRARRSLSIGSLGITLVPVPWRYAPCAPCADGTPLAVELRPVPHAVFNVFDARRRHHGSSLPARDHCAGAVCCRIRPARRRPANAGQGRGPRPLR